MIFLIAAVLWFGACIACRSGPRPQLCVTSTEVCLATCRHMGRPTLEATNRNYDCNAPEPVRCTCGGK